MLQRRIELCGDAPRAPMQPCRRRAWSPTGGPPAQGSAPAGASQSEKSQGVRETESPDSFDDTVKKTENYVSVFSGEVHLNAFERAAKHHPWVNSLGMKFVPVVGTQVLFSVWDTRVQDFMMFERSTGYDAGAGGSFVQGSTYPVVLISWNDAQEFCKWLTKRERSAGDLPQSRE